ncbi:MAG: tetratricopeptide repeat protein [Deltaproteobacteria bacterium]|nr:tetratricopeptide repeat protein [Deltaproteobacteria bacterium]
MTSSKRCASLATHLVGCLAVVLGLATVTAPPRHVRAQATDGTVPPADGTVTDGTATTPPQDGTVTAAPADGTVTTTTAPTDGTVSGTGTATDPWSGTQDVRPPAFLDTTDRRIRDDRPPPTEEQVAALREMEAEVDRFTQSGHSYRSAIVSILRREYGQRRRDREQGYSRQIREEERLQNDAREAAIRAFERFIRRYPNDPTYTADAMFRLGELYYERSAITFAEAVEIDPAATTGHPDFNPTINLYRDLVARFPNYRRIDGVYYLIGYCLNEMGNLEEARLAWLTLVCANHFTYTGAPPAPAAEEPEPPVDPNAAHPAAAILAPTTPTVEAPFVDPYLDCRPITPEAEFVSETWLRIGEYHFDFDFEPHFLERAVSAYSHVLANPEDRNYNLALYKVAWAYYRASRYPEAIAHFAQLVDWSDREQERTGRAGSELRAEAIQYLGITFAYDDWNENQIPDGQEGLPTAIQRLQDPSLLPQDRPWTAEVFFHTGQVFFDQAQYELAIEVWELALQRFPLHHRNPEITTLVARAYRRLNDREGELRTSELIQNYLPGGEWYDANPDHPREQRQAEEMAEAIVINQAIQHHQQATVLRRRAVQNQDEAMLQQAIAEYNLAAGLYRRYIELYPNRPDAYELQYNLAECLFWSEQYEEAAQAYAGVRDSNLDDTFLSISARRVVESLKRLLDTSVQRGEITVQTEPPPPSGTPLRVSPVTMPDIVQRVAQAREIYLARVDERADTEHVRSAYDFNNALLLYAYGYWPQARERFRRIYDERCSGPLGAPEGRVAYDNLHNMAVALQDAAEVERLARELVERGCSFTPDGTRIERTREFCQSEAGRSDPICDANETITDVGFLHAMELYNQARAASQTPEDQLCAAQVSPESRRLYEQSATEMVNAVNATPDHREAPRALIQAAIALECVGLNDSAMRIYTRVIDEGGGRRSDDPEEQARLTGILATAYFRLAYSANRNFDYDSAIQNYRILADDRRFSGSEYTTQRTDALINAARIFEYQQNYTQAADYYRRAAEAVQDIDTRRVAHYRVAEMSYRRRDWPGTVREMQGFIDRYRSDAGAGELLVTAAWRIAEARQAARQDRDYRTALQNVVATYERSGQQPGSIAAEYAAQSRFTIANEQLQPLRERVRVAPGRQATVQSFVQALRTQIDNNAREVRTVVDGYAPILGYRRPTWTIAAFVQQGQAYEILASAIINATLTPLPDDVQRRMRGASADVRLEVETQFQDQVRQVLEQQIRPVECFAVARYALAARAARVGAIDNEFTRTAVARLQSYGDERIAECIAEASAQDATFGAYTPGEFARARPGQTLTMDPGIAAPALAGADE